jgi:O-antigen/teichoic acid export membrane protein
MASGLRDFVMTFGAKILILGCTIGAQSCLARMLHAEGRGSYAVAVLFGTMLNLIFLVGTDVAGRYFVANRRFTVSEGVAHILACGLIGCAAAVGAGLVLMQLPLAFLEKATPLCFYLALATIPVSVLSVASLTMLATLRDFGWYAGIGIASAVSYLVLNVLFLWVFQWDVAGGMLAIIVNGALTVAVGMAVLRRMHGLVAAWPTWKGIREMFGYGIRYYAGGMSNQVNFQIGTMILAFFATKEEIGMFSLAAVMTMQIMTVTNSLGEVVMPRVAGDAQGRPELVAQVSRMVSLVCGPLLLGLAVLATPVTLILFGSEYLPMVPIIQILCVGFFLRSACKMIEYYFLMTNHPGVSSTATALGIAANLGLLWLLMPWIGLEGAAAAMVGSFVVSGIILMIAFRRYSGMRPLEVWRYRRTDWAALVEAARGLRAKLRGSTSTAN